LKIPPKAGVREKVKFMGMPKNMLFTLPHTLSPFYGSTLLTVLSLSKDGKGDKGDEVIKERFYVKPTRNF
jgi:hypothetical protein